MTVWAVIVWAAIGPDWYCRNKTSLLVALLSRKLTVVIAVDDLTVGIGNLAAMLVSSQPASKAGAAAIGGVPLLGR